jgi:hypothetical protein
VPVFAWCLAPVLGFLVGHCSDFGADADPRLFEVGGGTAALVALAVFVELAVVLGALIAQQGRSEANYLLTRSVVRANAGLFLIAEGSALYAVATQRSSTLLVFLLGVPMLAQLFLLIECAYHRVGASRIRGG